MSVGLGQTRIVFPPLAILVVPARILELEPLEVFFGHGVDAPEVGEPACGKELGGLMHIPLVRDAVPGFFNVFVVDLQTVFLQREQIAAIIVVVNPAPPHLRIALAILAAILRSVLNEGTNGRVNEAVVVPECILEVAFQQQSVFRVGESH